MKNFKRGLIIGMAAMTAFSAINMSVAAENNTELIKVERVEPIRTNNVLPIRHPVALNIQIFDNGKEIVLENKPFMGPENSIYVPLREMIGKLGYDDTNSFIRWNDGTIDVGLFDGNTTYLYRIRIGDEMTRFKRNDGNVLSSISFEDDEVGTSISNGLIPVLDNDNTYVSIKTLNYMLYGYTNKRNPETNNVYELEYTMHDGNGNNWYNYTSMRYYVDENQENYVALPDYWNGKIEKITENGKTKCYHKEIKEKYGDSMGLLFYTEKNTTGIDDITSGQTLLSEKDGYKYIFGIPTDVQYPTGNKAEDKKLAAEYQEMTKDLEFIKSTFTPKLIKLNYNYYDTDRVFDFDNELVYIDEPIKIVGTPDENSGVSVFTSPYAKSDVSYVVNNFLRCLESSAFEEMKNYCTINCVQEYFGDNEVFGIKSAIADTISYPYKTDEALAEKEIGITAKITPAPKSTFGKKEITATFKLHLIKQADGTYLIDSFSK